MIKYGSVCSGIESASVAWEPLGMRAIWLSEIEPFPCAVLAHHWPNTPNLGDMTTLPALIRIGLIPAPAILVGGTPCQAFSVAGKRDSLEDDRGQLTLSYVDLFNAIDEQRQGDEAVAVWENVPGVLNTKDNAFGCFLGELAGSSCELKPSGKRWGNAGYIAGPQRAIAWRVLDAQFFGVAQRRRRVFVVASARDGFDPGEVLFEQEGMRRDITPSRETGENNSASVESCTSIAEQSIGYFPLSGHSHFILDNISSPVNAHEAKEWSDLIVQGIPRRGLAVRRLTPTECERLQGFPDGHTDVPYRGKPATDSPRYKAIGNSKAVPVIQWVGKRLLAELSQ